MVSAGRMISLHNKNWMALHKFSNHLTLELDTWAAVVRKKPQNCINTPITRQYWTVGVEGLTQEDDVEVVGVHEPGGGPGHPLADRPLHDGVSAVRKCGAVLPYWTVNKAEVLKWFTRCYWKTDWSWKNIWPKINVLIAGLLQQQHVTFVCNTFIWTDLHYLDLNWILTSYTNKSVSLVFTWKSSSFLSASSLSRALNLPSSASVSVISMMSSWVTVPAGLERNW